MSWIYVSSTGNLYHFGAYADKGYSGSGSYANQPDAEWRSDLGPIPQGQYTIGKIGNHTVMRDGKPVTGCDGKNIVLSSAMVLTPQGHDCCGRFGFLIHGGNPAGGSSHGCIILPLGTRQKVGSSDDNVLQVVAFEDDNPFRRPKTPEPPVVPIPAKVFYAAPDATAVRPPVHYPLAK